MDIIYRLGEANVGDVIARMPDEPAYNAARRIIEVLIRKGYVTYRQCSRPPGPDSSALLVGRMNADAILRRVVNHRRIRQ
jgi:hypothetical protein